MTYRDIKRAIKDIVNDDNKLYKVACNHFEYEYGRCLYRYAYNSVFELNYVALISFRSFIKDLLHTFDNLYNDKCTDDFTDAVQRHFSGWQCNGYCISVVTTFNLHTITVMDSNYKKVIRNMLIDLFDLTTVESTTVESTTVESTTVESTTVDTDNNNNTYKMLLIAMLINSIVITSVTYNHNIIIVIVIVISFTVSNAVVSMIVFNDTS